MPWALATHETLKAPNQQWLISTAIALSIIVAAEIAKRAAADRRQGPSERPVGALASSDCHLNVTTGLAGQQHVRAVMTSGAARSSSATSSFQAADVPAKPAAQLELIILVQVGFRVPD